MYERVVAVIPTYNEGENIELLMSKLKDMNWILIVDDGSSDGTIEKLTKLQDSHGNILVFQRPRKQGFGAALKDGFNLALERFPFTRLVEMDADLSHDPSIIPKLLSINADLVIGSRYLRDSQIENWTPFRKTLSIGANLLARFLLRLRVHDATSGFRVYTRRTVQMIVEKANHTGFEFLVEIAWLASKSGLTIAEFPIGFRNRSLGKSKMRCLEEMRHYLLFILKHLK